MKHWKVLGLLSKGWRTEDIAEGAGYPVVWVRKLAGRYNQGEAEALRDNRRNNPDKPPLLDEAGQAALKRPIDEDEPPNGAQWNGPNVVACMSSYLGGSVGPVRE